MNLTRRRVLATISQLAAAAALSACGKSSREAAAIQDDVALLASVAYDILPFPELAPELYVQAGSQALKNGGNEVADGLKALRLATSGTPWKELDEGSRISALTSLQDSAFFRSLRGTTLQVVLGTPAARQLVGYGGSAIEHGGYLHRGFDDISWLPVAKNH